MKQALIALTCLLTFCTQAYALKSSDFPSSWSGWTQEMYDEFESICFGEPDCSYSFEKDGIYYWITDVEAKTLRVVNEHKFFAWDYFLEGLATKEYFANRYDNPYTESEITIPATVEYEGVTYTVTEIGNNAFSGSDNLVSVKMPETITDLCFAPFAYCKNLSNVELSPNLQYLSISCFEGCSSLKRIDLTYIEGFDYQVSIFRMGPNHRYTVLEEIVLPVNRTLYTWSGFSSLKRVYLHLEKPPFLQPEHFAFDQVVLENATLYVPDDSVDKYKADSNWGRFNHIAPESSSAKAAIADKEAFSINGCVLTAGEVQLEVYALDGRRVASVQPALSATLERGIYIVCLPDGKASKIYIK